MRYSAAVKVRGKNRNLAVSLLVARRFPVMRNSFPVIFQGEFR